ncbi:unnamed protein product, partial [Phaeothamnion confervicola]
CARFGRPWTAAPDRLFRAVRRGGRGTLSRSMFEDALSALGVQLSASEMHMLAHGCMDKKDDGRIDYIECVEQERSTRLCSLDSLRREKFPTAGGSQGRLSHPPPLTINPTYPCGKRAQVLRRSGVEEAVASLCKMMLAAEGDGAGNCLEAFQNFDRGGTGEICEDDLDEGLRMLGLGLSRTDVHRLMLEYEGTKPGSIRYRDILHVTSGRLITARRQSQQDRLDVLAARLRHDLGAAALLDLDPGIELRQAFDCTQSATMGAAHFRKTLDSLGMRPSEDEAQLLLDVLDENALGRINRRAFLVLMEEAQSPAAAAGTARTPRGARMRRGAARTPRPSRTPRGVAWTPRGSSPRRGLAQASSPVAGTRAAGALERRRSGRDVWESKVSWDSAALSGSADSGGTARHADMDDDLIDSSHKTEAHRDSDPSPAAKRWAGKTGKGLGGRDGRYRQQSGRHEN